MYVFIMGIDLYVCLLQVELYLYVCGKDLAMLSKTLAVMGQSKITGTFKNNFCILSIKYFV